MSDTPRTDACEYVAIRRHVHYDRFAIARELERELAAMQAQSDRLAEALREVLEDHAQAGCISIEAQEVAEAALEAVKGGDNE